MKARAFRGLGNPFLDFIGVGTAFGAVGELADDQCAQLASSQMAKTDADIRDVQDNWKPNGFYTPDQMQQINMFATEVIGRAQAAIAAANRELQVPRHRDLLLKAHEELNDKLLDPTIFINAVQSAKAQGFQTIESQGYKRWIVNVLKGARAATFVTNMVACARPNVLFGVLQALNQAAISLVELVVAVGNAVVAIGSAVLKIPDILGSFFTALKFLPWFLLAAGGYYVGVKTKVIPEKYDPLRLRERETFRPWRRIGE